jgi:hypothetical protein
VQPIPFTQPLETLVEKFDAAYQQLMAITPTVAAVDDLCTKMKNWPLYWPSAKF